MPRLSDELHGHLYALWLRNNKQPILTEELHKFLTRRIPYIIKTAEVRGLIVQIPGTDKWLPRPRDPARLS